jgi:Myotubularin-like phosphatase domain
MDQIYAFRYKEVHAAQAEEQKVNGWELYDFRKEFARQGIGSRTKAWRFTDINTNFTVSPSGSILQRGRRLISPMDSLVLPDISSPDGRAFSHQ